MVTTSGFGMIIKSKIIPRVNFMAFIPSPVCNIKSVSAQNVNRLIVFRLKQKFWVIVYINMKR